MTCEPIADDSSPVETNIVSDDNVPELLCPLVIRNESVVEGVQKGDNVCSVVWGWMMVKDAILTESCTHRYGATMLSTGLNNDMASDDISARRPSLCKA